MQPELIVGGLVPLSTNDFPGRLAAVLFCQGCPWRCSYCHNPHLQGKCGTVQLDWEGILDFLKRRVDLLDAVVFSGGEPTAQPAIVAAAVQVKKLGFAVGLHSAGCLPNTLQRLLPEIDWIGLDIKAGKDHYDDVTGITNSGALAYKSLQLVLQSGVDYEVRTTVHDRLIDESHLLVLAQHLAEIGVACFAVQQFRSEGCLDDRLNREGKSQISSSLLKKLECMFPKFRYRPA